MLAHTHSLTTPWTIVRADNKELARINIIKDLLSRLDYKDKDERLIMPDKHVVTSFDTLFIEEGLLAS